MKTAKVIARPRSGAKARIAFTHAGGGLLVGSALVIAICIINTWLRGSTPDLSRHPALPWILLILGASLGAFIGAVTAHSEIKKMVTVTAHNPKSINIYTNGIRRSFPTTAIGSILLDQDLVIISPSGYELLRTRCSIPTQNLNKVLEYVELPAVSTLDPHENEFHWWTPGCGALSADANFILNARASALSAGHYAHAEELRRAVMGLGIIIRDRHTTRHCESAQQWRLLEAPVREKIMA